MVIDFIFSVFIHSKLFHHVLEPDQVLMMTLLPRMERETVNWSWKKIILSLSAGESYQSRLAEAKPSVFFASKCTREKDVVTTQSCVQLVHTKAHCLITIMDRERVPKSKITE